MQKIKTKKIKIITRRKELLREGENERVYDLKIDYWFYIFLNSLPPTPAGIKGRGRKWGLKWCIITSGTDRNHRPYATRSFTQRQAAVWNEAVAKWNKEHPSEEHVHPIPPFERLWKNFLMHNLIAGNPFSEDEKQGIDRRDRRVIDHINGDSFDNRKENLRICTHNQNTMNSKKAKNCSSIYKGVYSWVNKSGTEYWRVEIQKKEKQPNGDFKSIVLFNRKYRKDEYTEEQCARIWDKEILRHRPEDVDFITLNFPEDKEKYLQEIKEEEIKAPVAQLDRALVS